MKPLALDLCCGLGGWTEGLLAEGWDVIGFDIERHQYGDLKYPAQLVIQDIRTLDGRQFREKVSLVVGSPPCVEFSYMAMPWRRGKQIAAALLGNGDFPEGYKGSRTIAELTALFDACVRIGREVECPTIIENVRGAQRWVGKAKWAWGSFLLWGDAPALMPITMRVRMKSKISCAPRNFSDRVASTPEEAHALHYRLPDGVKAGDRNMAAATGGHKWTTSFAATEGFKTSGMNWSDQTKRGQDFTRIAGQQAGIKVGKDDFFENGSDWMKARGGPKSNARKAASAMIARIPIILARWIAKTYYPR